MSDLSPNEGSKIFYWGGINTAYFESFIAPKQMQKFRKKQFTYKGINKKFLIVQRNQYDHDRG
jgi:hypothetical protein